MANIPADINAVITRIDRQHEMSALPSTLTPVERYDVELATLFPQYQIVNTTEFNYGRSFRYLVVLSRDSDAAALDDAVLTGAVERHGTIDAINLAISAVAPYYLVRYISYRWVNGEMEEDWSDEALTPPQQNATEVLFAWLNKKRFKHLDPAIAKTLVPDVATDLCDRGEATVADCLFFG